MPRAEYQCHSEKRGYIMNEISPCGPRLLHLFLKRSRTVMLAVLCALALCACGKQSDPYGDPQETVWRYGPSSISLNVSSSTDLNLYQNKAHTLAICAYQLSNDRGLNELAGSAAGMDQLVLCGRFDDSVVHHEQLFFTPGSSRNLVLNRHEGAKLFVLVAGYYDSRRGSSVRTVRIPVVDVSDSWVPLVGPTHKEAGSIALDVYLDKTSLQVVETKR